MGLLDRIRGRPDDPQEERADVRKGEGDELFPGAQEDVGEADSHVESERAAELRRDGEAVRHQGF